MVDLYAEVETQPFFDNAPHKARFDGVAAYDFNTDTFRPQITIAGPTVKTFYRYRDKVKIFDRDNNDSLVAQSGDQYTTRLSNRQVEGSLIILSAIFKFIDDLALSVADKNTTYNDANFKLMIEAFNVADLAHAKERAGSVSTALPGWNATIKAIVDEMCVELCV